jgi:peptide-methionine (S)-S-oxide reductase
MFFSSDKKLRIPTPDQALPGRGTKVPVAARHFVLNAPLEGPFPEDTRKAMFGLGCFWGAERKFWQTGGVYTTAVGYAAGHTPNPTYEEVCSGLTGHNEVVLVVYRPAALSYEQLLQVFWESHDPTQGMRQGNDRGTQYRSGVYYFDDAQHQQATDSLQRYERALSDAGYGSITTEIIAAPPFYYAEDYHEQYLAKNPRGYCGVGGTGVVCPADRA